MSNDFIDLTECCFIYPNKIGKTLKQENGGFTLKWQEEKIQKKGSHKI